MSKATHTYRYYIPGHGSTAEDSFEFESVFAEEDGKWLAEEAAEDYHDEHDGWEASWPIEFVILNGDKELGRFEVERESVPQFTARTVSATSTTGASK